VLYKTRGIALSHIKYRETSIIAKIFTETWGMQSYMIQGVRTKKPKHSMALFQPLTLLDMVVYHKKHVRIQRVAEVKLHIPMSNILGDIQKATIAIFLAELLTKAIREEERNEKLFTFLWQSVVALGQQSAGYAGFYLTFMLRLCNYLGFGIKHAQEMNVQLRSAGQQGELQQEELALINNLLAGALHVPQKLSKTVTRNILTGMVKFYQLHIDALHTLRSLKVLQEIS
jgi:DNA repair protein RecO (recombination protein O)